jgi:hypothetical protein
MYDNKIRLSQDVLDKAEQIAVEWGLKNARAAVEAVFRRYSDDYLHGRGSHYPEGTRLVSVDHSAYPTGYPTGQLPPNVMTLERSGGRSPKPDCEALDALDDLLAM